MDRSITAAAITMDRKPTALIVRENLPFLRMD